MTAGKVGGGVMVLQVVVVVVVGVHQKGVHR
jgi:hypothetical protein